MYATPLQGQLNMKPELQTLPISEIAVGDRFRRDLGDIQELADSIKAVGLLNPPLVGTDGVLVCGFRRIQAAKLLGWKEIECRVFDPEDTLLAEHDENEVRKAFTHSERVAIAQAYKEKLGNRAGRPKKEEAEIQENFPEFPKGQQTRDIAAKAAGFGNAKTFEQAEKVVDKGIKPLVEAMDTGEVSVSAAAELASEPEEVQEEVIKQGPEAVKQHAKAKREARKAKPAKPVQTPAKPEASPEPVPEIVPKSIPEPTPEPVQPVDSPSPPPSFDPLEYDVDEDGVVYKLDEEEVYERKCDAAFKAIAEAIRQALAIRENDVFHKSRVKSYIRSCDSIIVLK